MSAPAGNPRPFLSPINRRRLDNFRANRRGFWSLWIFLVLFVLSMFSEFLANDRPILVRFEGRFYAPVFADYPEETFLGAAGFLPLTDYAVPEVAEAIDQKGWAIWPPVRYSYRTLNNELPEPAPARPSWLLAKAERCAGYPAGADDPKCILGTWNWLGTDDQGRDVLARVLYGFRISVLFGLILTLISAVIGVNAGAIQGYFGGIVDLIFQRLIEIWSSMPALYILLIVAGSSESPPGFFLLLFTMLLFSWVSFVGVVRAEFLRARNFEYINAARALGVSNRSIIYRHMLPNAMVATLTFLPFILNGSISTLTSLDYLGLGLPPGSPSLGELLAQGQRNLQSPWLGFAGFFSISLMLSLLIFIGEAARDAFDPRKTFA
jgi:microcin C transport system permease protein